MVTDAAAGYLRKIFRVPNQGVIREECHHRFWPKYSFNNPRVNCFVSYFNILDELSTLFAVFKKVRTTEQLVVGVFGVFEALVNLCVCSVAPPELLGCKNIRPKIVRPIDRQHHKGQWRQVSRVFISPTTSNVAAVADNAAKSGLHEDRHRALPFH
jgi:hypothetical protein